MKTTKARKKTIKFIAVDILYNSWNLGAMR